MHTQQLDIYRNLEFLSTTKINIFMTQSDSAFQFLILLNENTASSQLNGIICEVATSQFMEYDTLIFSNYSCQLIRLVNR